jgi:hypothetical protein
MKTKFTLLLLALALLACYPALAGEKLTDDAIKQKLLGYWGNARHSYLYKADGVRYMCPVEPGVTTNKWDVKNGLYYEDGVPYQILTLTDTKFTYHSTGKDSITCKYQRQTKKEAEGE